MAFRDFTLIPITRPHPFCVNHNFMYRFDRDVLWCITCKRMWTAKELYAEHR